MTRTEPSADPASANGDWRVSSVTMPRSLSGANGLRFGPDGALYNASAFGSELARIDVESGELTIVSPRGSPIVSPDDLAFDSSGALYVAECMNARVTELKDGGYRTIDDDVVGANGITVHEDRIFVGQFIPSGDIFEIFRDDRSRVRIAEGLNGPNGLTIGPDRMLYAALVFPGQVARVSIDGGPVEIVAEGLAAPCSCRTGPDGLVYVGLGGSGDVITIDPVTLEQTVVHSTGKPGMDNLDLLPDGRLFVSYYVDGSVYELLADNQSRELLAPGLMAPYGLAATTSGVCIADGLGAALLTYDHDLKRTEKITDEGFPGFVRGVAAADDRTAMFVTNNLGMVTKHAENVWATYEVWGEDLSTCLVGLAQLPSGGVAVADADGGRVLHLPSAGVVEVLTTGMGRPSGVAVAADGTVVVTDEDRGTVERVDPGGTRVVLASDLRHPQGVTVVGTAALICEVGRGRVVSVPIEGGEATTIAVGMPFGMPDGSLRETLNGLPEMIPGPIVPFAGIDVAASGAVYVAGDRAGLIALLEPVARS
jgi:sugar lactone lactonase YvrE